MKRNTLGIFMWLVISAAFVGPGTVTTAGAAGAEYGYQLLWALLFSTLACILLQEGAARASILSGKSLGGLIAFRYKNGLRLAWWLVGAVVFGCIAYEAGNILGAISGLALALNVNTKIMTLAIGLASATLLFFGNIKIVTNTLGVLVAFMGAGFLLMAIKTTGSFGQVGMGLIRPALPDGSAILALGLIGTTIVPYNLFLGSGISSGQTIKSMRTGVVIAVLTGGIISIAIAVSAAPINGTFSFGQMAVTMQENLGVFGKYLFIFGLFAAGFTSAVTAPLASAVSVESLQKDSGTGQADRKKWFRRTWVLVLLAGLFFGLIDVKPVPAIILAQALNGLLLPFLAIALWLILNDKKLIGTSNVNGLFLNGCYFTVVVITCLLGLLNVAKAAGKALSFEINTIELLPFLLSLGLFIALLVAFKIRAEIKENQ